MLSCCPEAWGSRLIMNERWAAAICAALCQFHFKSARRRAANGQETLIYSAERDDFLIRRPWRFKGLWTSRTPTFGLCDLRSTCVRRAVHSGKALLWLRCAEVCPVWLSHRLYHWCSLRSKVTADRPVRTPAWTRRWNRKNSVRKKKFFLLTHSSAFWEKAHLLSCRELDE